jgi:hypothetical protein
MMQEYAFSNGHTSYKPPNFTNGGLMYHNNVDSNGDYISGSYSTLGDAGHASDMNRATASTQVESRFSNISTVAFPSSYKSTKYGLTENESIINRNYTSYPLGHDHARGIGNSSTPSTSSAQLKAAH